MCSLFQKYFQLNEIMEQRRSWHMFGEDSREMICPVCNRRIYTRVEIVPSILAWVMVSIYCFLCCCLAWMPLCINSWLTYRHYCPACNALLGTYHPA